MIFVCVGSREYQFNRLLKEIDRLIEKGQITDEVFGQIGQSDYIPKNFEYTNFLSNKEFKNMQQQSNLIISHGGTGALISSLKMGKQVISVPRLEKYNEHIDNHQLQISQVLTDQGYLLQVLNIKDLINKIIEIDKNPINKNFKSNSKILDIILEYIERINK